MRKVCGTEKANEDTRTTGDSLMSFMHSVFSKNCKKGNQVRKLFCKKEGNNYRQKIAKEEKATKEIL